MESDINQSSQLELFHNTVHCPCSFDSIYSIQKKLLLCNMCQCPSFSSQNWIAKISTTPAPSQTLH